MTGNSEPTWLQPMIDQRLALMAASMGSEAIAEAAELGTLVMTTLTEPREGASELVRSYWERACDNCGRYVSENAAGGVQFMTGHKQLEFRGMSVIITFGACTLCASPTGD